MCVSGGSSDLLRMILVRGWHVSFMTYYWQAYLVTRLCQFCRKTYTNARTHVQALSLLSKNIHTAVHKGTDLEARQNMLLGSMLAGMAFANAPVAAVHALACECSCN